MSRVPALAVVFVLAFSVRLGHVLEIRDTVLFEAPLVDAHDYDVAAREIARKGPGALEVPYYQPPLYPILLGAVYRLTDGSYLAPRVFQALLGAGTVALVFALAASGGRRRAAWFAAGLLALYGPVLFFEGELLPPALVLFLDAGAVWLLLRADAARHAAPRIAAAGLLLGLSSAARPTGLLLAAAAVWWVASGARALGERGRAAGLLAALVLAPILPFTLANWLGAGEPVLLSHNGGINFYLGNGAGSESLTAIQPGHAWDRLQVEPHRAGVHSRAGESRYWVRRAVSEVLADPGAWAVALARKVVRLLDVRETPRNLDYEVWRKDSALLSLPLVGFGLVAPLACLGLALGATAARARLLFLLVLAAVGAENLLFFVAGRYRLEAVPLLCVLAGQGLDRALSLGPRRIPPRALLATAAFAAFVHVDLLGERAIDAGRAALNRGVAQRRQGLLASAVRSYEQALRANPGDPDAHRLLAEIALEQGDLERALQSYERALAGAPDYMMAFLGKAQALERAGRGEEAERTYREALRVDPWSFEVRLNYGVLLAKDGRTTQARRMFEEGLRLAPRETRFLANLQQLDRLEQRR
jgi:Tfp pilus assembly protein PilF